MTKVSTVLLAREQRQSFLRILEEAFKAKDTRSFVNATKAVDWGMCQPKDFIRALDLALSLGAFAVARDISEKGLAQEGHGIEIDATVFVPDTDSWGKFPSFLGLSDCLDRLCFAIDSSTQSFYFGRP